MQSIRQAFDRHAANYDDRFSKNVLGEEIRSEVWRIADGAFGSASRLLDLGAGTGEDTIHFASLGKHVTAVDVSPEMIARIGEKALVRRVREYVDPVVASMQEWTPDSPEPYDGIISNFGALNCSPELDWLGRLAAGVLRPGAPLVLVTMGRFYPLETAVHLLKLKPGMAFRRFRRPCVVSVEGVPVDVYYHSPQTIRAALGPAFKLEAIRGLCALRPVPGLEHLSRYRVVNKLRRLDEFLCRWRPTSSWADHFISVWRYQPCDPL